MSENKKGSKLLIGVEQYEAFIMEESFNNMDFALGKAKNFIL